MTVTGSDTAYPQGGSGGSGAFNITCATRANVGLQEDNGYRTRVDNTLARGAELGHYHFNDASVGATQQAAFFWGRLYRYAPGQMLALDIEYEVVNGRTVTQAMNPDQAGMFFDYLHSQGVPYSGMLAYVNLSILNQWDWTPVWRRGVHKWIAHPGSDPGNGWDIWQNGIINGTDQDISRTTLKGLYNVMATLDQEDLHNIALAVLTASFTNSQNLQVNVASALSGIYFYGDYMAQRFNEVKAAIAAIGVQLTPEQITALSDEIAKALPAPVVTFPDYTPKGNPTP